MDKTTGQESKERRGERRAGERKLALHNLAHRQVKGCAGTAGENVGLLNANYSLYNRKD